MGPETKIMKKAYHRQLTPKFLPAIPKPKPKPVSTIEVDPSVKAFTDSQYVEPPTEKEKKKVEIRFLPKK